VRLRPDWGPPRKNESRRMKFRRQNVPCRKDPQHDRQAGNTTVSPSPTEAGKQANAAVVAIGPHWYLLRSKKYHLRANASGEARAISGGGLLGGNTRPGSSLIPPGMAQKARQPGGGFYWRRRWDQLRRRAIIAVKLVSSEINGPESICFIVKCVG